MSATPPVRVLGVDACKRGWVAISNDGRGYFGTTIHELMTEAEADGALSVVAIDMPIGLPLTTLRQSDAEARRIIGRRASSVFTTPVRAAISAVTHAEATAISVQATGKGLSQQAFALSRKILEVDAWARAAPHRVIEVHPEVSFATMNGAPLLYAKSTWAGAEERRRLLAEAGVEVPSDLGRAGSLAGVDDVLDAAAASWTARRHAAGTAVSHPDVPEDFGDGHLAAIWA